MRLTLRTRRTVHAPAPPSQFNPDPGAGKLPEQPTLFLRDQVRLPEFGEEPISKGLELPRTPVVRLDFLDAEPPAAPPPYGSGPLPAELKLPRRPVRANFRRDQKWHRREHSEISQTELPPNAEPVPNRWRLPFDAWRRYGNSDETPYFRAAPALWAPYHQSLLKGDLPLWGDDHFLNLTANSETEFETRLLPTPSNISAARPGSTEFFGQGEQLLINQRFSLSVELFKGHTVFEPPEWTLRFQPVYNINYVQVRETGLVSPDPRGFGAGNNQPPPDNSGVATPGDVDTLLGGQLGGTIHSRRPVERLKHDIALQEAFYERHLGDLSDNYDFMAVRAGSQPFVSDFRGFIFSDVNLGARLFGNWDDNRLQYNLVFFDMREKDTFSELNTFDSRDQLVMIANLYRQDFLTRGYTAQWSFHANLDDGRFHYDRTGSLARPEPLGAVAAHAVRAYYLGWSGDGHVGRWNISHAFYQALGRDEFNGIAGRPVNINAQMLALELSYDRDWIRYKGSIFYASGDGDSQDGQATGFDSIVDQPSFVGGPFSYYVRQGFNLGGTLVSLKQRNSLVPNLRTSKTEGQANFVNPGVFLAGLGTEVDVTPKVRHFFNANYVRFIETDSLQTALLSSNVDAELGYDLSTGFQYRPLLSDNIILSLGAGLFVPGRGYRDIFSRNESPVPGFVTNGDNDSVLYSALIAVSLTY